MTATNQRQARLDRQLIRLVDRRARIVAQLEMLTLTLRQLDQEIERNHEESIWVNQPQTA
jgi:hypothetical protein